MISATRQPVSFRKAARTMSFCRATSRKSWSRNGERNMVDATVRSP